MPKPFADAANVLTPLRGLSFEAAHRQIETHCIILPYTVHDRRSYGRANLRRTQGKTRGIGKTGWRTPQRRARIPRWRKRGRQRLRPGALSRHALLRAMGAAAGGGAATAHVSRGQ